MIRSSPPLPGSPRASSGPSPWSNWTVASLHSSRRRRRWSGRVHAPREMVVGGTSPAAETGADARDRPKTAANSASRATRRRAPCPPTDGGGAVRAGHGGLGKLPGAASAVAPPTSVPAEGPPGFTGRTAGSGPPCRPRRSRGLPAVGRAQRASMLPIASTAKRRTVALGSVESARRSDSAPAAGGPIRRSAWTASSRLHGCRSRQRARSGTTRSVPGPAAGTACAAHCRARSFSPRSRLLSTGGARCRSRSDAATSEGRCRPELHLRLGERPRHQIGARLHESVERDRGRGGERRPLARVCSRCPPALRRSAAPAPVAPRPRAPAPPRHGRPRLRRGALRSRGTPRPGPPAASAAAAWKATSRARAPRPFSAGLGLRLRSARGRGTALRRRAAGPAEPGGASPTTARGEPPRYRAPRSPRSGGTRGPRSRRSRPGRCARGVVRFMSLPPRLVARAVGEARSNGGGATRVARVTFFAGMGIGDSGRSR